MSDNPVVYRGTPCELCDHFKSWHQSDTGACFGNCKCKGFQPPKEKS